MSEKIVNYYRIEKAIGYLTESFKEQPDLDDIAGKVYMSPFHFQIKVWEALVKIPFGSVASYQQIAEAIGQPHSARAVGSAVGSNTILYLIPCHRIISKDGTLGNYHFGKVRKLTMIGWENALLNRF